MKKRYIIIFLSLLLLFSFPVTHVQASMVWTTQLVDPTYGFRMSTSLALDSSGNPHISYYDATNNDLKYASWNGASWNIQIVDSAGDVGIEFSCFGFQRQPTHKLL